MVCVFVVGQSVSVGSMIVMRILCSVSVWWWIWRVFM